MIVPITFLFNLRIKYFTHPPEKNEADLSSEIVKEFTSAFSLDNLKAVEDDEMDALPSARPSVMVGLEAGSMLDAARPADDVEDDDDKMEDGDENLDPDGLLPDGLEVVKEGRKKKGEKGGKEQKDRKEDPLFKIEGNTRMDKQRKMMEKKAKKDRRRRERVAEGLSDNMESAFAALTGGAGSDDYSFETDFNL